MLMSFDATCHLLKERFGTESIATSEFRDNRRIHVAGAALLRDPEMP